MFRSSTLAISAVVVALAAPVSLGQATLQWQPLGGGSALTELVAGQTYELHAVGVTTGLQGWTIDLSASTGASVASGAEADRSSVSVPGIWNNSDIPGSGGTSFFDVLVPDQLICNFMDTGPGSIVTDADQYLCNVTLGGTPGTLSTAGPNTEGVGGDTLTGSTITVVPIPGDFDYDGDVDNDDFSTLQACYVGPGGTIQPGPGGEECERADIDSDNDVDLVDFATFQTHFTD